jgi:23S rRNA pseudouridine2605 synthase
MSRRAAEAEIAAGNVTVNDVIAEIGMRITPGVDEVRHNGKLIKISEESSGKRCFTYIMLNKPRGYVTTMKDEKDRPCIAPLVSDVRTRLYPVGRLDMYSDGLLLMTNDGDFTARLTHPSHMIAKIYSVRLRGHLEERDLQQLREPMEIDGYKLRPIEVEMIDNDGIDNRSLPYTTVKFTLHEGRNRQIRKMCEKSNLKVVSLRRIAIGSVKLGDLPIGKWRYLTEDEINSLMTESGNDNK